MSKQNETKTPLEISGDEIKKPMRSFSLGQVIQLAISVTTDELRPYMTLENI